MTEAELLGEIDGANAKIDRAYAAYDRAHDKRSALIERLTAEHGPGPVCTNGTHSGCDEWTRCRTEGVCAYGAAPTEEQAVERERRKQIRYLRTKVKKLMDAFDVLQRYEPREVVRLVSEGYYSLFLDAADKHIAMLESWRDAKSLPDTTVKVRPRRAAPAPTQAEVEQSDKAHAAEQAQLKDKIRQGAELRIGDVKQEISRRWAVETLKPQYSVRPAFSAYMDVTLYQRGEDPELVVSSLPPEQHALFMSEVDGYILTVKALRDVHSLPTRARLQVV